MNLNQSYIFLLRHQWRAVTSETSHAIGMPKPGHKIEYF